MEFPQGESMGSMYLSNLDMTQSNLDLDQRAQGDQVPDPQEHPDPRAGVPRVIGTPITLITMITLSRDYFHPVVRLVP
jgi:hypothetical protein